MKLATCPALLYSAVKLLRFLKLRLAIKECLKRSIKNTQQLSPDELHTTTSRIDYLKVFPNVQWVWTAHYLKTLLSAWIIPDITPERGYTGHLTEQRILAGSSYDDLRQSAAVLVSAVYHLTEIVKTV